MSDPKEVHFPTVYFSQSLKEVIVRGFHGTSGTNAANILKVGFRASSADTLKLGPGVYFYELITHAWGWVTNRRRTQDPTVLGATITLGNCLDFYDNETGLAFQRYRNGLIQKLISDTRTRAEAEELLPEPKIVAMFAQRLLPDTVRLEYPGHLVSPGGVISVDKRRVICVRNLERISDIQIQTAQTAKGL